MSWRDGIISAADASFRLRLMLAIAFQSQPRNHPLRKRNETIVNDNGTAATPADHARPQHTRDVLPSNSFGGSRTSHAPSASSSAVAPLLLLPPPVGAAVDCYATRGRVMKVVYASLSSLLDGHTLFAGHASPHDHFYRYTLTPGAAEQHLADETGDVDAEYVLLGHTHLPMVRRVGERVLVNPGSVGQPRDGDPRASYAVIDDGRVTLKRAAYDVERTVGDLRKLRLEEDVTSRLIAFYSGILATGSSAAWVSRLAATPATWKGMSTSPLRLVVH